MQKMICIPVEQYERMIENYDKVFAKLEEMKRFFQEVGKGHENYQENYSKSTLFNS